MKNIGIVTSTRAEYGLLMPFIREMRKHESKSLKISLIVTGTHLSKKYGMTVSLTVNDLRKLESAAVVETRSMGMKGTRIKILNPCLRERLK